MPYIKEEDKPKFDRQLRPLSQLIMSLGELNYCCTVLMREEVRKRGEKYEKLSAIHGAVRDAADEFKRRVVDVYEDQKILENGDVYKESL